MSRKIKKLTRIILVIFLFIITAALLSFYIFFRMPVPNYNGSIIISGLKDEVEVRSDDHGIPHIFAKVSKTFFSRRDT